MNNIWKLLFLVNLFFSYKLNGQNIQGHIIDQDKQPIPYAVIRIKNVTSNLIEAQGLSDTLGKFNFPVKNGRYVLLITSIGFTPYSEDTINLTTSENFDIDPIVLQLDKKSLKEVVITGRKNLIEQKGEKIIMNIANSTLNTGMSAAEALQFAPGVDASGGAVKISGRQNTEIWINGKPSKLNLNNIPTDQIERIEIIQNPSVKYDAAVEGIINVVLKEWATKGLNGQVYGIYRQGVYPGGSGGGILNYNAKNILVYVDVDVENQKSYDKSYSSSKYDLTNPPIVVNTLENQVWKSQSAFVNGGLDWHVNTKNLVSLSGEYKKNYTPFYSNQGRYDFYTLDNNHHDSTTNISDQAKLNNDNVSLRINYTGSFDSLGKALDVSVEYFLLNNQENYLYNFQFLKPENTPLRADEDFKSNNILKSEVWAVKLNYTQPLNKSQQLTIGGKISNPGINSNMNYYYQNIENWLPIMDRTSEFNSSEYISAAYLSWNGTWKKLSAQTGLRAEYTVGHGVFNGNSKQSYDYLNYFPSGLINYAFSEKHKVSLSYSRKIQRPDFAMLNPYINYTGPYTIFVGSPELKPQYNDNYNLTYTVLNTYSFVLYHNQNHNRINQISEQYDDTRTILYRNINYESSNTGISTNLPLHLASWLSSNNSIAVFYQRERGTVQSQPFDRQTVAAEIASLETITLPHKWKIQLLNSYHSPSKWGIVNQKGYFIFTAAVGRSFFNNQLTFSLKGEDIFKTSRENFYVEFANQNKTGYHVRDRQCIKLSVKYRFDKGKKRARVDSEKAAEDEKNRLGK
jgi:ferric enterobactin receptor